MVAGWLDIPDGRCADFVERQHLATNTRPENCWAHLLVHSACEAKYIECDPTHPNSTRLKELPLEDRSLLGREA
jgi:hypothetical protein